MRDNLFLIINYINDNLIYGSKVSSDKIDSLFKEFSIPYAEKYLVYEEIKSLSISVIQSNHSLKNKIDRLFLCIDKKKELRESILLEWYEEENINLEMRKLIRNHLNSSGYSVINDVDRITDEKEFDFLNDFDLDGLDKVLEDDDFKEEISKLKNVVDKSHNIDYLIEYHANGEDSYKKVDALDKIVSANKKLVWKIVQRYKNMATASFSVEDMFQVGMEGLMKATKKFKLSMGYQFSTYATWWIRQSITRSIADYSTTIRIPVHMRDRIIKYIRVENDFWNENSRIATKEELADLIGVSVSEINDLQVYKDLSNLTSLETPIGTDEVSLFGDFIPDEKNQSPEGRAYEESLKNEIQLSFHQKLTHKEATILSLRFGLEDGRERTLEEIGQVQGVTRERIRQIEAKAIRKLQNSKTLERLGCFYHDRK